MKKAKMEDIIDRLHHIRMGLLSLTEDSLPTHKLALATEVEESIALANSFVEPTSTRNDLEAQFK